jgi:hypothetical protein
MFWGAASSNPQNETSEEDSYRVASDVIQNVRADTVCDCNQDSKALAEIDPLGKGRSNPTLHSKLM